MDLISLFRRTNIHQDKLHSQNSWTIFPGLIMWSRIVSVRMRHSYSDRARSSKKKKEANKQQDVNYMAAVKSTLHVGLKLSTVYREECQTAAPESASGEQKVPFVCVRVCACVCVCVSVQACIHVVYVIGNRHSPTHKCCTNNTSSDCKLIKSRVHVCRSWQTDAIIPLCFGVTGRGCFWRRAEIICTLASVCICWFSPDQMEDTAGRKVSHCVSVALISLSPVEWTTWLTTLKVCP